MKLYLKIAIVIVAFVVGFFLGRKTIDVEEKVTFVKGETIHDTKIFSQEECADLISSNPDLSGSAIDLIVSGLLYE